VRVAFGSFVLDGERHQLVRDGREVHLSRKAYELLALLIQERPRVITKGELHERLWPSTFVSDATLASLVAELRRALDDPARQHHVVRTVHGVGYAFDGDVTEASAQTARRRSIAPLWMSWNRERQHMPSLCAACWMPVPFCSAEPTCRSN
jgi:DNA-binding winged helix-turn-helix (wHTH) protein